MEKSDNISAKEGNNFQIKPNVKVFVKRESYLTEMFKVNHFRTIRNIFASIWIIALFTDIIDDLMEMKIPLSHLEEIERIFGQFPLVIFTWVKMMIYSMLAFPLLMFFKGLTNKYSIIIGFFAPFLCSLIYYPTKMVFDHSLPFGSRSIICLEQVRLLMKIYSFLRESISYDNNCASSMITSDNSKKVDESKVVENPDFSHYLYFLFAPTLIYRSSYPRTDSIRWRFVVSQFFQILICILFVYYVYYFRLSIVFKNYGKDSFSMKQFVKNTLEAAIPCTMILLNGFYLFLHCWLNAWAEMLCFADRKFYEDWWNSNSYSDYYRRWNIVVHDWLYTYIYLDFKNYIYPSLTIGQLVVFFVSAVVHEYVIAVVIQFFFPVLFILFGFFGVILQQLKSKKNSNSDGWNIFLWTTFMFGSGILLSLYCMEAYALKNCPRQNETLMDYIKPRTFLSECQ